MTNTREEIDLSAGSNPPQLSWVGTPHPGFVQLEEHPELIPVVTEAVDKVIASSNINRQRDVGLINSAEQAAADAALTTYERMVFAAIQASDAANEARRSRVPETAATAEGIAEVVSDTAPEVYNVEEAAADHVNLVAMKAASELAELVSIEDEAAASTAAALVVRAVGDAFEVNAEARADAASSVAQAAADAAAEVADEAASTAIAVERGVISTAFDRHQDALKTCYEVAAAAAQAVLTHQATQEPLQAHPHPPELNSKPA